MVTIGGKYYDDAVVRQLADEKGVTFEEYVKLTEEGEKAVSICPKCGYKGEETDAFCFNCGTKLDIRFCPSCGNQVTTQANFCKKCGYNYDERL